MIKPAGKVDNYTVSLTGAINKTTQTTSTQVNFTGLLPGREYNVTVQTVSGSCSQTSAPVTEATYPTPPGILSFTTITTKILTLSWSEPVNMTGVNKAYNISYGISPSTNLSVTSPTTNVTLQSLISGTNYSIAVVTVGVRGYQSSPVTTSVYTKPISVKSLQIGAVTSYSVSLTWSKPDEYQTSYSYRVQTFNSSALMVNNTIVTSESATIMNLTPGETYTFLVYTRAADIITESDPVSNMICTDPSPPGILSFTTITTKNLTLSWSEPVNMAGVNKTYNISYGISPSTNLSVTSPTTSVTLQSLISGTNYSIAVVTVGVRGYQSSPVTTSVYTRFLRDVILDYLNENNCVTPYQHGFMRNRSCQTNLISFYEEVSYRLDHGESLDVVYLDFSKAFDTVPHKRLQTFSAAAGEEKGAGSERLDDGRFALLRFYGSM
ncbi:unnamed protein product [Ranitomeya imitator]|uniref:Fibronectin type-III domain-containing protein n=1 Tax=Ranitomeya imitator TaxID=111125 RepID=A0ABN9MLA7_9NEOB|nr:unnamed protein product [Ranitomeya imitator]